MLFCLLLSRDLLGETRPIKREREERSFFTCASRMSRKQRFLGQGGEVQSGYECTFVYPLSKDLQGECSICLQVLREPFLVSCCGYRFCHSCILPIQKSKRPCPLCNSKFSTLPDKQLQRTLNEKLVHCSNKDSGCPWKGQLADFEDHYAKCSFLEVECSHCHQKFKKCNIDSHQKKCSSKLVKCKFCKSHEDTFTKLISIHIKDCPMYPVECPNDCGSKPFRKNLSNHLDEKCPLAVLDCFFKYAGCTAQVLRRDMSQHREDYSEEHILMTVMKIEELEVENQLLKEQLQYKEQELAVLRVKQRFSSGPCKSSATILVSNLAPGTNKQMLKSTFGQFGLVEDIDYENRTHTARITFTSEESAKTALARSEGTGIKLLSQKLSLKAVY